jgi:hypothetical protein
VHFLLEVAQQQRHRLERLADVVAGGRKEPGGRGRSDFGPVARGGQVAGALGDQMFEAVGGLDPVGDVGMGARDADRMARGIALG